MGPGKPPREAVYNRLRMGSHDNGGGYGWFFSLRHNSNGDDDAMCIVAAKSASIRVRGM